MIECDVFDRFIVENDLIRNDIDKISDQGGEILKGAKKLASQVRSLMHTHSNSRLSNLMGLVPQSVEKVKDDDDQSQISLDRFDCVFASQLSKSRSRSRSQGSDKSPRSPRKGKPVDSDEDIEQQLSDHSRKSFGDSDRD